MHPAKSVIYFTTASGAGYGLAIWLAVLSYLGFLPGSALFGFVAMALSLGLIISGLLSSTFHLGHPERAWRAFSQWRTSWLSREGVAAILTFIPLSIFAISWVFFKNNTGTSAIIGLLGAVMSFLTVFTTSMIYASLKSIPAWHNIWTKLGYLVLSLMSGALLALSLMAIFGLGDAAYHFFPVCIALIGAGLMIKALYWRHIHKSAPVSTAETATGLGQFGKVSFAGSPHTQDNYLLKEMGFKIARKHARKIRILAVFLGFVIPVVILGLAFHDMSGTYRVPAYILATVLSFTGLIFERWLFFAEAKHVVTLYYGESRI